MFPILVFVLTCIQVKTYTLENPLELKKQFSSNKSISIRNVRIEGSLLMNEYFKGNLIRALNDSGEFINVESYSENSKNNFVLDLKFNTYENELNVHPLYFPLALLTLTIYIWVGGPVIEYGNKMNYTIQIYDPNLKLIKTKTKDFEFKDWENIYSRFKLRREMPIYRFDEIKKTIRESL